MGYFVLPTRTNFSRPFKIICGLCGNHKNEVTSKVDNIISLVHQWMKKRAEEDKPFLTGSFSREMLIYTWRGAKEGEDDPEPGIVFKGEVSIVTNHKMRDKEVIELLNEIAIIIATEVNQRRIYITYGNETWILQEEKKSSRR